ncbi:MAG: hypothetical protein LBU70_08345 [Chitinispirillales bacterium]|jgi:hypothetical protein|nr:hypothetical protein [Chitinispirillales bacterium]
MSFNTGKVTGSGATQAYYQNLQSKHAGGAGAAAEAAGAAASDQYTAGADAPAGGVYSKEATMQRLWNMAEARHASMRSMVESLIGGATGQNGQAFWAMAANQGNYDNFRVDAATQARAEELTGEDGYFGVRKTTERIMEFAQALAGAGADEKTIENLRSGVQAGFDYVAGLFGGFDKLPQLTRDTYDSIMGEFDKWIGGPAA